MDVQPLKEALLEGGILSLFVILNAPSKLNRLAKGHVCGHLRCHGRKDHTTLAHRGNSVHDPIMRILVINKYFMCSEEDEGFYCSFIGN